jgi:glycosyltransferase involved in cell wall biosynthesis
MKKVLIITYYWIPSGGSGVQRWVKFTKYLRDFGWEPVVYAPENPEYPSEDESFVKDIPNDVVVIKKTIWEPYNIYRSLFGKKNETINAGFISEEKKSLKHKISFWLRGNLLIPDPRVFWVQPSVNFLRKYLIDNKIDTIITTGPPHSVHLIGKKLKAHLPQVNWIADFRDPWTSVYYFKDMHIGLFANMMHKKLEQSVIKSADKVIVVSDGMKQEFEQMRSEVQLITNGYDNETIDNEQVILDNKFSISYIGLLTERQNPQVLWRVLEELCNEIPDFRTNLEIKLTGKIDYSAIESIEKFKLTPNLVHSSYIPHSEAIKQQRQSQILLLLMLNQPNTGSILTGKLFEYLAAKRPILGIGSPTGDAAKLLLDTQAGVMIDFNSNSVLKKQLKAYYEQYKLGNLSVNSASIEKYSRRELTAQLAKLLKTTKTNKTKKLI